MISAKPKGSADIGPSEMAADHALLEGSLAEDGSDKPSKSQRKRDMLALQDLGEELVKLSDERLAALKIPEELSLAVREAQHIRSHEGRRRQLQYIGKLMRSVEVAPIQSQLALWKGTSRAAAAALHQLESWRSRLLLDDAALSEFVAFAGPLEPDDLRSLRQVIRLAREERRAERAPRHYRELFRLLKQLTHPDAVEP
ncbi:MAG: ribosome biogenesis factor YjgA [Burkholderiaceae bacterium]|jgi:ribosome-associated protein